MYSEVAFQIKNTHLSNISDNFKTKRFVDEFDAAFTGSDSRARAKDSQHFSQQAKASKSSIAQIESDTTQNTSS